MKIEKVVEYDLDNLKEITQDTTDIRILYNDSEMILVLVDLDSLSDFVKDECYYNENEHFVRKISVNNEDKYIAYKLIPENENEKKLLSINPWIRQGGTREAEVMFKDILMSKSKKNYESEEFISAMYTSVWDDGATFTIPCRLDLVNLRVYDIEDSGHDENHGCFVSEYVEYMDNGQFKRIDQNELIFDY